MNRSLTIHAKVGSLPWRAHPSEDTTIGELEAAISMFKLDVLRTTADEILLVQTDEAIRDGAPPPEMEELGTAMFGQDHNAILVTESGIHKTLDGLGLEILEEDADREMIGDDVDLGIGNIGNK